MLPPYLPPMCILLTAQGNFCPQTSLPGLMSYRKGLSHTTSWLLPKNFATSPPFQEKNMQKEAYIYTNKYWKKSRDSKPKRGRNLTILISYTLTASPGKLSPGSCQHCCLWNTCGQRSGTVSNSYSHTSTNPANIDKPVTRDVSIHYTDTPHLTQATEKRFPGYIYLLCHY